MAGSFQTPIRRRTALALLGGAAGLAACAPGKPSSGGLGRGGAAAVTLTAEQVDQLVAGLPVRTVTDLGTMRLGAGLTPPTNRWFSGLVFGDEPMAVFPVPLGFAVTDTGFEIWLPRVSTNGTSILGARAGGLVNVLDGATVSAVVTAYDVASITVELRDSGGAIGELRLAQGSPAVGFTAKRDVQLAAPVAYEAAGSAWQVTVDGTVYGLVGTVSVDGSTARVSAGDTASWFVAPQGVSVAELASHVSPVAAVELAWEVAEESVTTRLRYVGGPTLVAALPHQHPIDAGEPLGTYDTILGTATLYAVETLAWSSPRWPVEAALDLGSLSGAQRASLAAQVRKDVGSAKPYPTDTYFGGKALYREAMLWQIAEAVGETDAATAVRERLTAALTLWCEPRGADQRATQCFVYDDLAKGVVGLEPSFGSDEFNDHHFHYGYFLYAAGVLCADDPELARRLAPVLDLLAADIASPADLGSFPMLRPFDVYASHSWASGTSPFADGNNQESSSEGVGAWAGLALWARVRRDKGLEEQAVWMHALESAGALTYWLQPDVAPFPGFEHQVMGIGWGAKRDYLTWFSPDPAAILAIQVLPASPSHGYLGAAPDKVGSAVTEALHGEGYGRQYTDWVLLYSSLGGPGQGEAALREIPAVADKLDDGLTLSYLQAFLSTR